MPGSQNPGAVGLLYSHKHQAGDILAGASTDVGPRYDRWWETSMLGVDAVDNVRSVSVFASETGAAVMMLFSTYNSWGCDFGGDFVQFTNSHRHKQFDDDIPQSMFSTEAPTIPLINSMLMVQSQRRSELRISYKEAFLPRWDDFGAKHLPKQVSFSGAPLLTWMPFPKGQQFLSEDQIYLYIDQRLIVDFSPYWANYHAEIYFWIHLKVEDGKVKSHVQRWSYWVEGGLFTQVVAAILEPNLILASQQLAKAVDEALSDIPAKVTGVYYLPGKQLDPLPEGENILKKSNVDDDVTIVFEF